MKLHRSVAIALLGVLPLSAWAGGRIVLDVGEDDGERGTMEFEFDGDRLRMDMPQSDAQGYMLLRDSKVFMVTNQGGQPMVFDLSAMGQMFAGMMNHADLDVGNELNGVYRLEDTGRTETVAGIEGRVYLASYTDEDGTNRTDEMVIGSHPVLREFSQTMGAWGQALAASFGVDTARASYDESMALIYGKGDGVLRFGNTYRIASLSQADIVASRFDLPANPQQMPNFGALLSGAGADAPAAESAEERRGGLFGNILGRQAERQVDRQTDKVENRTQREVDGAVDRVFNRALDGLFGR